MDFAKLRAQIAAQLDIEAVAEVLGADGLAKINSSLRSIESGVSEMQENLTHANTESKNRKLKIREMATEQETFKEQIEELTGKADTSELTAELETLRTYKKDNLANMRGGFIEGFAKVAEHDNFAKAKGFFKLPKLNAEGGLLKAEDGSFDFADVSDVDMESNIAEMNKLNALGYFETAEGGEPENKNRANGDLNEGVPKDLNAKIEAATTMAELHALTPD